MDEAIRFDWDKANTVLRGDLVRVVTALDASKNEAREYLQAKGIAL